MQTLAEQKKQLEEQIAKRDKMINDTEESLIVEKALLKQDKKKLEIMNSALAQREKVENALSKDQPETR